MSLRVAILDLWSLTPYYERYLAQALSAEGVDAKLYVTRYPNAPAYFEETGMRLHAPMDRVASLRISNDRLRRILKVGEYFLNQLSLLRRWKKNPPDVLHIQWLPMARHAGTDLRFLRRVKKMGIPVVYTVHNFLPHDAKPSDEAVYRRIYAEVDRLICHNRTSFDELVHRFAVPANKIDMVEHGPLFHDVPRPSREQARATFNLRESDVAVLWQGVMSPYKGLNVLIESWKNVHARVPSAKMIIAGTGKREFVDSIRQKIEQAGIASSVHDAIRFIETNELPAFFVAADVLVYPYSEVTTSGALITGLTYNKPVVVSDIKGFREVLPGNAAVFVPSGDANALSSALIELIEAPSLRSNYEKNLAKLDMQNAWQGIAQKTIRCYQAATSGEHCPSPAQEKRQADVLSACR